MTRGSVISFIMAMAFSLWVPPLWAGERIVALAPHACEILFAIGAGAEVVGAVDFCDYPEAARSIPRVGSYERVNLEPALRTRPTMAVVMNRSVEGAQQLESMGVKLIESYPEDVEGVIADIRRIGTLSGHAGQATRLADSLQQRLDKVRQHKVKNVRVFYEIWGEPLLTPGKRHFISSLLHEAGASNVFDNVDLEMARVSTESVMRAMPQVVIIPDESRDVSARTAYWQKWLGKDVHIITVNPDLLHRPGPRLLDGLESLQRKLEDAGLDETRGGSESNGHQ